MYFRELPNISYVSLLPNQNRSDERIEVKNLFKRAKLRTDIDQSVTSFDYYLIQDNERPDIIAQKVYDNADLDWVILVTNNITSIRNQWPLSNNDLYNYRIGARYGLETETANINPTFTIDKKAGVINFDSTMANQQCVLQYISDGMENGNNSEIQVNKLFEDYIYAYIQYALLNSKFGVQEYIVNRAKKNKQALLRNAKIRLSNIHPSRLLMNLRGENKWLK